jgi:hypothetical protein
MGTAKWYSAKGSVSSFGTVAGRISSCHQQSEPARRHKTRAAPRRGDNAETEREIPVVVLDPLR